MPETRRITSQPCEPRFAKRTAGDSLPGVGAAGVGGCAGLFRSYTVKRISARTQCLTIFQVGTLLPPAVRWCVGTGGALGSSGGGAFASLSRWRTRRSQCS